MAEPKRGQSAICPVHGKRTQDGWNADGRCNAIVGRGDGKNGPIGWPLLCGRQIEPFKPAPSENVTELREASNG